MQRQQAGGHSNRLAGESSPYLLQHAHNPVEWYPWGEEALSLARRENRPILLSIGYSACHWCHVMAHESFEDAATAEVMNRHYVNIKVDREERPDLDRIYQAAHQLLTGRGGGWPLTVFLDPDQVPFFAGTYFPPEPRHGLPAFRDLLERAAGFRRDHPDRLTEQGERLRAALSAGLPREGCAGGPDTAPIAAAREALAESYDRHHGGFGGAPKFPHPGALELLMHLGAAGDWEAQAMALGSLRAMAGGGIHDQLGGGFFRYAVDERWEIPHFEKMLYDNGPLLTLYTDAWQLTGDPLFRRVAEGIGGWALREMQSSEGGYYATLDADSGGGEGGFYLWEPAEVERLLTPEEYRVAAVRFGLDQPANFEGCWHLKTAVADDELVHRFGLPEAELIRLLSSAAEKLLRARSSRPAPGRDEKVLTAWNALMVRGMARAGRVLGRAEFVASAERAVDFLRRELYRDDRLLAVYKDGAARLPGYLDDHAFLIEALLELQQARWRDGEIEFALQLAYTLLEHFEDKSRGGFFFTADDQEALIHRPKPLADESMPSGNGVAARALLRLGRLLGEERLVAGAERTLHAAWSALSDYPHAHPTLLLALDELLTPPDSLVIRGRQEDIVSWQAALAPFHNPHKLIFAIPAGAAPPGDLAGKAPAGGTIAYLCRGQTCLPPVDTLQQVIALLGGGDAVGTDSLTPEIV